MVMSRPRIPNVALLVVGMLMGWGLANIRPAQIRAGGGDRSGESIVVTGPVLIRYDEGSKVQIPLEAIYLLDYKAGRLLGTVPSLHGTVGSSRYLGAFAERDLVADFKLDLENGPTTAFPDDHRSHGQLQCGLGAALCLRDDHQPARDLSDPSTDCRNDGQHAA